MMKDYYRLLMNGFIAILCLFKIPFALPHPVPCLDYSSRDITAFDDCADLPHGHSSECLNFSNNSLKDLPGNLATCSSGLTQLDISFNRFTQLPYRSLAGLDHLHYLRADGNQIRSPQDGWRPLSNLTRISLVDNRLQNIPPNLLEIFPDLKEGDFSENNVTDVPLFTRLCHHRSNDIYVCLMDNPLKNLNLKHFIEEECVTHVTVNDNMLVISTATPDAQRIFNVSIFHNSKTISCDQVIGAKHLSKLNVNVTCIHPTGASDRLKVNLSRSPTTFITTSAEADGRVTPMLGPSFSSSAVTYCVTIMLCCFTLWSFITLVW